MSRRRSCGLPSLMGAIGALALVACPGADAPTDAAQPNVILISIDTLRADHLGLYGYGRDTSPYLDRLALQSVVFDNAITQSSWTLPAHMSLMTSLHAPSHGVVEETRSLGEDVTTLAQTLQQAGYRTAAFVNWIFVGRSYGFARGFDDFRELVSADPQQKPFSNEDYRAAAVTRHAIEWLAEEPREPFFLFLHYFDPHADYDPPEPYASMFDRRYRGTATGAYTWIRPYIKRLRHGPRARGPIEPRDLEHVVSLYDGEIRYVDTQLERLHFELEGRDLLDRTLLVVVGDHGEEFDDHGSMEGHGWTLYEEVVRVPLILRLPGGERAGRTNQLAQLIDVAPTILEASGLAPPPAFQGRPLLPARRGEAQTRGRLAFSHTDRFTRKRSVRGERYKLIWSEEQQATPLFWPDPAGLELYDLLEDPGERHDLALERPDLVEPLRLALESWLEESTRLGAGRSPGSPVELSPAERELLRRLGYVE